MIDERQVREMLERRAGKISASPTDEPKAIRRARRRLALNATVGVLAGLAVVSGALAGLRTIQATPTPADRPTPPPSPAKLGSLAYEVDGDIYVAEWDGSNAVRIADGRPPNDCRPFGLGEYWGEGPIWSPDGQYLAYRHTNCDGPSEAWRDVVISDTEGNVIAEFRPWSSVNRLRGTSGVGWDISWSPDSTRVAVWADLFQTIGIFGVDGARQTLLTMPPGMMDAGDHDPGWLPDGESLLVPPDVVVPIDGSSPYTHWLADRRPDGVAYSPDGSRVAFLSRRSLVVAQAVGANPQEVFDDGAVDPVWSPAGDRIAFTSRKPGSAFGWDQLRVVDLATGTVTLLFEADGSDRGTEVDLSVIDFSPEGDRILFSRMEAINGDPSDTGSFRLQGTGSLWSVDTDGSDLRRLVTGTAWGDWFSPPKEPPSPTRPRSSPSPPPSPRDPNEQLVHRVIEFARSPSRKAFDAIPLAKDGVWLGLGPRLVAKRSLEELSKPSGWVLDVDYFFRAGVGPFSALELLAARREVRVSVGPHRHCASPPMPPPKKFAELDRLSVQPREIESCLQWWTVDFFVSADGTIQAITLDHWEP